MALRDVSDEAVWSDKEGKECPFVDVGARADSESVRVQVLLR